MWVAMFQESTVGEEKTPIGKNKWGNVYQWVKGKAKEAAHFLEQKKEGYIKGVFHNKELGDIDLVWGNEKGGLNHIIEKHITKHNDFNSLDEAINIIESVIENGTITNKYGSNISLSYNNYRVSIAQSEEGNWVITAFDTSRSLDEKRRKFDTTIGDQSITKEENGTLVSPNLSSASKDTTNSQTDKISKHYYLLLRI